MTVDILLSELRLAPECQSRVESNHDATEEYARVYRETPERMPAISVWMVAGVPHVVDGFHRVTAAREAGLTHLRCEVLGDGPIRGAILASTKANKDHGIRRSRACVRRSIRMTLESSPEWSDRSIALHVGCDHKTIAAVRAESSSGEFPTPTPEHTPAKRIDVRGVERPAQQPRREPEPVAQAAETSLPSVIPAKAVEPVKREESDTETPYVCPSIGATATEYADAIRLLRIRWERTSRKTRAHRVGVDDLLRAEGLIRLCEAVECPRCAGAGGACTSCGGDGVMTEQDARITRRSMEAGR